MPNWLLEVFLTVHGLAFLGTKYTCPCCGWRVREFTNGGKSFKVRHLSYCPRCDSKARHRRDWLFLIKETNLFSEHLRLLHVSPKYCFSRHFTKMPNLDYVGVDLSPRRNINIKMDVATTPIQSNTFDAIICIHVLEHVQDDRKAMREFYRVLKPGGWTLVSSPIRLDQNTVEDPTVTSREERQRLFGERSHYRYYGYDMLNRLEESGFQVQLDLGQDVDQKTQKSYGLRDDENIFFCRKP
jgi:predicted SAM-dependent methyltransferase